jgi:aminoglycoside phosphotransferase (APT) family kinase protein
VDVDADLVRRLVAARFPQWAALPVARVGAASTDHAIFRLGDDLCVRLPRVEWALGQAAKEHRWLPVLAPHLPLPIPEPVALAEPAEGYPWHWSVYSWLDGEAVTPGTVDLADAARTLAGFVRTLHALDATGGPPPGEHNFGRGADLATRCAWMEEAVASLGGTDETRRAVAVWEEALAAPPYDGPGVWVHGDLQPANLLAREGRIGAVIDFGGLGVGDPAVDLLPAWNLLDADARRVFREALQTDDATWLRGRGWAVSQAVIALPYYRERNPVVAAAARVTLAAALEDGQA